MRTRLRPRHVFKEYPTFGKTFGQNLLTVTWGRDMNLTVREIIIQMCTTFSGMLSMEMSEKSKIAQMNIKDTKHSKGDRL